MTTDREWSSLQRAFAHTLDEAAALRRETVLLRHLLHSVTRQLEWCNGTTSPDALRFRIESAVRMVGHMKHNHAWAWSNDRGPAPIIVEAAQ